MFDMLKLYVRLAVKKHLQIQPPSNPPCEVAPVEVGDEIEFSQLYSLGVNPHDGFEMLVGIEYVEYCPDETAFIRILSGSTEEPKQYKRKVKYDKANNRYILISGRRVYLNEHTKPRVRYEQ